MQSGKYELEQITIGVKEAVDYKTVILIDLTLNIRKVPYNWCKRYFSEIIHLKIKKL